MEDIRKFIERVLPEYENDLRSLCVIPSVVAAPEGKYPYGKACAEALDKAISIAEGYGFRTENHEYHCGSVLMGDSDTEIGIIAHLDVVPAGNGWTYEPYALTVDKELYIGRGSEDDKGPLLIALYAMRYFRENNIKLPFTVRLVMGSDEEVGCSDLDYFLSVRKPPVFSFTPDSEFPVCIGEKNMVRLKICLGKLDASVSEIAAGTVTNAVPGEAYAVVNGKRYETVGATAHASMPENGVNAISLLADKLAEENVIPECNKAAFRFLADAGRDYKGKLLGIDCEDEHFGYLTCVASVLRVENGMLYQSFDIRCPGSRSGNEVIRLATEAVQKLGFTVASSNSNDGYFKLPDSKEIVALTEACRSVIGGECKPYTMGGGTYARHMPGAVAFGARIDGYTDTLGAGRGKAHDRDEYLSIAEVKMATEIIIKSLMNLSEIYSG